MKNYQLVKVLSCFILVIGIGYAGVKGPYYDDIRALGMGNTSVAVTTDRTAIFHNPAGLCLIDDVQFSFTPLAVGIDGIFFTLLQQMVDQGHKLEDLSLVDAEFIDMINEYDGQWVGVKYIPEVTIAAKRIGFGVYTVFPLGVRIESGHLIPKLVLRGERDLVFTWGVGFPLRHENNYGGISIEYLQRTPLKMMSTYSETFHLFDDISNTPLGIIGDYSEIQHGVSFDVGFMHNYKNGIRLAWGVKDVLGVIGGKLVVPPQVDLGCAYFFPQVEKVKAIDNLIVAFELTSIFGLEPVTNKYEQIWKKVHVGAELDMHYVALRLGLSQGYPTAGIGLRFGMFKVDYSYFTEELGYYAGQLPKKQHILAAGVEVKVKSKKAKEASIRLGDLYNRAMTLYSEGEYYDAHLIFGQILFEYPDFFKNDWVGLYYGLCQENMDMREVAKANFIKTKTDYPGSAVVPHAELGVLRLHYRNNNSVGVAKQFDVLNTKQTPDSLKYHADYYQGQTFLRDGKYQKAVELFRLIPKNHHEYIFAQHSIAVAYALSDRMSKVPDILYEITKLTPKTKAQEEAINRSYLFLGYIFYEGLGDQRQSLLKAVTALRKVPESSYYYEDAVLGFAWCGVGARRWEDCLAAGEVLKTVSKKEALHCELMLLEGYIHMINEKYDKALEVLSEADQKIKAISQPSSNKKNAAELESKNVRSRYGKIASDINKIALSKQSSSTQKVIDSLKITQGEYENKLRDFAVFFDEFARGSFFARNIKKIRFDVEYALVKIEKMKYQSKFKKSIKKEVKETKEIDDKMKKLEDELETLDEDEDLDF